MKTVSDFSFNNRTALLRVDYNVPLDGDNVSDPTRILMSLPTINKILQDGGRVVLISHLGRPNGEVNLQYSLRPVFNYLNNVYPNDVSFASCSDDPSNYFSKIILLENLRFNPKEQSRSLVFAKELARWGDIYVSDAFGALHRTDTSITILPKQFSDRCIGFLVQKELNNADYLLGKPKKPFTLIVGGAKVKDKIKTIRALLSRINRLILGGGVANSFLKVEGNEVGVSIHDDDCQEEILYILDYCAISNIEVILPKDFIVVSHNENSDFWPEVVDISDVKKNHSILDIGPETIDIFSDHIEDSSTILWAGPMGFIENDAFVHGTVRVADAVAEAIKAGAFSLIGGGNTLSAINKNNSSNFGIVSTGGSALLQYIGSKTLVGLEPFK